ncbi:unnamed protein product [Ixodes persulcatus]
MPGTREVTGCAGSYGDLSKPFLAMWLLVCWKNVEVMQVLRNLLLHVESSWGYWYEVYNAVI